jgi:hypothetical protein
VAWTVAVDSTTESIEHVLSGSVTSGNSFDLISPKSEVVVTMLAQQALLNDTTNPKLTRPGYELKHLPCDPPEVVPAKGWNLTFPPGVAMPTWKLTIELRQSQNLYETVRVRKQDPLPLAMAIISAVVSLAGIWKQVFTWCEGPISTLREFCSRRCRLRRQRNTFDGLQLASMGDAMVISDISESARAPFPRYQSGADWVAALKSDRHQWLEAFDGVYQTAQQQEQTIREQQQTIQQLQVMLLESISRQDSLVHRIDALEGRT